MMPAVKSVEKNKTDNSRSCLPDQFSGAFEVHSSRNGVKMRAPAVSPSHQVRQISPYWLHEANPLSVRLVTPNVAATAVLMAPAKNANRRMSLLHSNAWRPLAYRMTRKEAMTASKVLPVAMPIEVRTEPAVLRLTRKAPAKMDGQKRIPRATSVAIAIPVGGHTGVALGWTEARRRLNFPATMYAAQTPNPIRISLGGGARRVPKLRTQVGEVLTPRPRFAIGAS